MAFFKRFIGKRWRKDKKIILFIIPNTTYQSELLQISKSVADNYDRIAYISVNRPTENIREIFREENIDTKKFLFIDAISKGVKPDITDHGILFINSPKNFEKFKTELNQILDKEKVECLIFDSLSTLLVYQDQNNIIKFAHDLITKLMIAKASGIFSCLSEDVDSAVINDISMFVDEVVDISKEEETKPKDMEKKEIMDRLEERLKSVRDAYAIKLVSEQTYLKTKKRIENQLRILEK